MRCEYVHKRAAGQAQRVVSEAVGTTCGRPRLGGAQGQCALLGRAAALLGRPGALAGAPGDQLLGPGLLLLHGAAQLRLGHAAALGTRLAVPLALRNFTITSAVRHLTVDCSINQTAQQCHRSALILGSMLGQTLGFQHYAQSAHPTLGSPSLVRLGRHTTSFVSAVWMSLHQQLYASD